MQDEQLRGPTLILKDDTTFTSKAKCHEKGFIYSLQILTACAVIHEFFRNDCVMPQYKHKLLRRIIRVSKVEKSQTKRLLTDASTSITSCIPTTSSEHDIVSRESSGYAGDIPIKLTPPLIAYDHGIFHEDYVTIERSILWLTQVSLPLVSMHSDPSEKKRKLIVRVTKRQYNAIRKRQMHKQGLSHELIELIIDIYLLNLTYLKLEYATHVPHPLHRAWNDIIINKGVDIRGIEQDRLDRFAFKSIEEYEQHITYVMILPLVYINQQT